MLSRFGHLAQVNCAEPLAPAIMDRHRTGRRFLITLAANRYHHAIAADGQSGPVFPRRSVGVRQQFDESILAGLFARSHDAVANGFGDLAKRGHGAGDAMFDLQEGSHRVLLVVGRPAANPFGQRRCRSARDDAQLQLQRPHARFARLQAFVDASSDLDRAEKCIERVRRFVAAAVGLASELEARRTIIDGRFGVVVSVVDYLTSGFTQLLRHFFSNAKVAAGVRGWVWNSRTSERSLAKCFCNRCDKSRGTEATDLRREGMRNPFQWCRRSITLSEMEHEKQARLSSDPSVHDLFPTTKPESQAIRPDWSDSTPHRRGARANRTECGIENKLTSRAGTTEWAAPAAADSPREAC